MESYPEHDCIDSKWQGFALKCINPTVAPTVISSFFYSLVTTYITQLLKQHNSNSQNFQELKLELRKEEEKILYYVAVYLVFSLLYKYRKLEKVRKSTILPLLQYSFSNHWDFLVIIHLIWMISWHMFKNGFVKLTVEVLWKWTSKHSFLFIK